MMFIREGGLFFTFYQLFVSNDSLLVMLYVSISGGYCLYLVNIRLTDAQ